MHPMHAVQIILSGQHSAFSFDFSRNASRARLPPHHTSQTIIPDSLMTKLKANSQKLNAEC
jgi:hypothetical protein